jgi:TetR/AcrR family transcriptional repressor of mexJK operon
VQLFEERESQIQEICDRQLLPQLALAYHENKIHAQDLIANVFSNAMRDGQIRSTDAGFLAEQFLYAVVEGPVRTMVISRKIAKSDKDLRERITSAVGLLLNGCRDHPAPRI